jgi:putative acetyltransferase
MNLRAASNKDIPQVKELVFAVLTEYGLKPDPEGTDADLKDIEATYIASGGMFSVLENEVGQVLGTVALFPLSSTTCELRKMYLDKNARGSGQGRRLLKHALSEARRLGFKIVELETASVLQDAIQMYIKYGFKPIEREHLPSRCDQAYALTL